MPQEIGPADEREHTVRKRGDGRYDVDGSVPLAVVSETLDVEFGDEIEAADRLIEVRSVDGTRISLLRIGEPE